MSDGRVCQRGHVEDSIEAGMTVDADGRMNVL
jgi:hypothetical protein